MSFPKKFLFGAATSSHQIEGDLCNNWTEWENSKSRTEKLIYEGKDPEEYKSKKASYHADRIEEDLDIMSELGLQAYRFSLEWSRIEPVEGEIDASGLDFYDRLLEGLNKRDITPFVTLWHWSIPVWLEEKGGLISPDFSPYFQRYAEAIIPLLQKHHVKYIITFNEPLVFSNLAYNEGRWPPQHTSKWSLFKAIKTLISTHKKVYTQIHQFYKDKKKTVQIGVAKHNIYFHTDGKGWLDRIRVRIFRYAWNEFFIDRIRNHQDFVGINYYFRDRIENGKSCNPNQKCSDMGWELYPEGVAKVCEEVYTRYNIPVYITEHGLADKNDLHREWYMKESFKALLLSIKKGNDIRGYMHWSFLDNYEWADGFGPCFGLVEVDYKNNGKRRIRKSAKWYKEYIKSYS